MSKRRPEKVQAWRATIEAWKRSGQTVNAFCRARGLTRSHFDRWRRVLAAQPGQSPPAPSPAFVPVRVVAEPMAEVVLRSGVVVRLPLSAAPETVTRLVAAVGAASC
jgi:transposase-like protein